MFNENELAAMAVLGLSFASFPFTAKEVEECLAEAKSFYKKAASVAHPDRGGSAEAFRKVRSSYELVVAALSDKRSPSMRATTPTPSKPTTVVFDGVEFESLSGVQENWRTIIARNWVRYDSYFRSQHEWRKVTTPKSLGIRAEMVRKTRMAGLSFTEAVRVETEMEKGYCNFFYDVKSYSKCTNEAEYAIYHNGSMTSFCKDHFLNTAHLHEMEQQKILAREFIHEQERVWKQWKQQPVKEPDPPSQRRKRPPPQWRRYP